MFSMGFQVFYCCASCRKICPQVFHNNKPLSSKSIATSGFGAGGDSKMGKLKVFENIVDYAGEAVTCFTTSPLSTMFALSRGFF
jgi:hypothetical protein